MEIIVFVGIGGGTLFFALIFILFALQGAAADATESVILFFDNNLLTISIILGIIVLLATVVLSAAYSGGDEVEKKKPSPVAVILFSLGTLLNMAQAAFVLVQLAKDPFLHHYGPILLVFSIIVALILLIIDFAVTLGITALSFTHPICIALLYIWAFAGACI